MVWAGGEVPVTWKAVFAPTARAPALLVGLFWSSNACLLFQLILEESSPVLFQSPVWLGQLTAGRYHLAPQFPSSGYLILFSTL